MSVHSLSVPGKSAFARRLFVAVSVGACLFGSAIHAQTTIVGKLPGELSVSPSGAATYRVPIEVPPGVAGMEPKLALGYSSQSGNGIMGMGWSLDGLSAITRCPQTMVADGAKGGVNHIPGDRFCQNGQRLINVLGTYGGAGSEYRTELESFSKITASGVAAGSAANGPQSFTVKTKAGLTMEYGSTTDSRIEAQGKSVVRVWALSEMRDAKGNSIAFNYDEDTGAAGALFGKFTSNQIAGWGGGSNKLDWVVARGVATTVAGGVGSELAGGKFANGAVTAAYGYLFNACASGNCGASPEENGAPVGQGVEGSTEWTLSGQVAGKAGPLGSYAFGPGVSFDGILPTDVGFVTDYSLPIRAGASVHFGGLVQLSAQNGSMLSMNGAESISYSAALGPLSGNFGLGMQTGLGGGGPSGVSFSWSPVLNVGAAAQAQVTRTSTLRGVGSWLRSKIGATQ